jgi:hypothetical protein
MDTDQRAFSLSEFCRLEGFSKSFFYQLRKKNLAPTVTDINGLLRISSTSRQEWHQRMLELAKSSAAQVEAERRRELATVAGKAAAASDRHISKRQKAPHRKRRR